jgi:regulator of RNase E activity RraA
MKTPNPFAPRLRAPLVLSVTLVALLVTPHLLLGVNLTAEQIMALTAEWKGERSADGRPKVPDDILRRMKNVSLEEAWGVLRSAGHTQQFEGDWMIIHPDQTIVGRAVTALYLPSRPDLDQHIRKLGREQKRIGPSNSWPIDILEKGDVYVADGFGKIIDGTLIGDNLGNAIYAKSGNGVVFNGSVRDLEGLSRIEGFNAFVRGWDPSAIKDMTMSGINVPVNLGRVTVLPGDVVLAKREGVIFIPPHLAEKVVVRAEVIALKDRFGHQRLREGVYTPGQIDRTWSADIVEDFMRWVDSRSDELPVSKDQLRDML